MERELYIHLGYYLKMKDGETEEQAKMRFYDMLESILSIDEQDSSWQIYETREQEI